MDSGGKSSLLDAVKRRFDEGLGRESVTRMLYIGIIPAGVDKRTVCDSHVDFLEEMDADVSGLMLVQQNTVLNLIEAAGDVVTALLRHMHTESLRESPCISDVRIVSVVEDCPSRAFVSWSYRSVSLAAEPGWKVEGDTLDLAYDMYNKIVAIGRQLTNSELSHEEQNQILDNLKQRFADYIPSNEKVKACCECEDMVAVAAYLDIYDVPVTVPTREDAVWPIPARLMY